MASLRDIKNKIVGVKKTRQITRAMNMVAAAKLRQVQGRTEAFAPYAAKFGEVLRSLSSGIDPEIHPLLAQPEEVKKVGVVVLTADRGLCGSFNMQLINKALAFFREAKARGQEVVLFSIGKKGGEFFRRRDFTMRENLAGVMNVVDFPLAQRVGDFAVNTFMSGEVQEFYLIHSRFESMASMKPVVTKLLPIQPEVDEEAEEKKAAGVGQEYLTEPSAEEILVDLLPRYVNVTTYQALLETATSEHASRMAAMDKATKNCKDMIENLTLAFNKARQATITSELMDIVGGAEALAQG